MNFHLFLLLVFVPLCIPLYDVNDESSFEIRWDSIQTSGGDSQRDQKLVLTTNFEEKYECYLPQPDKQHDGESTNANVPIDEDELLKRLFNDQPCTNRMESYWSYELCHKTHMRQFHEEFLPDKPQSILLGDTLYPYYSMNFTGGTVCDLTGGSRSSVVLYICAEGETGRIIQISEIESCHYQVVFASKHLCGNPAYRTKRRPVHMLTCTSTDSSPSKPSNLLQFEKDRKDMSLSKTSRLDALFEAAEFKNIKVEAERKDNVIVYRIRALNEDEIEEKKNEEESSPTYDDLIAHGIPLLITTVPQLAITR